MKKLLLAVAAAMLPLALLGWGAFRLYRATAPDRAATIPSTRVRRGDVTFTVTAKGDLQGGNSQNLVAPMVGGAALTITFLRESGEPVKRGEKVAEFDTTEQEFKLREEEADLAEAEAQLARAQGESDAKEEEAHLALLSARADFRIAELETRRNELLSVLAAQQNDLALEAARDKAQKIEKDLADRLATARAGIAIQEAARTKARMAADTARRNIAAMTLRAERDGYLARQANTAGEYRFGSYLPPVQVGDTIRPGMAVAQIPDLESWEASVRVGELDRGHLAVGQGAEIAVVALGGRQLAGRVKSIGGTTGPPWDRHFECRLSVEEAPPELRPGMSVRVRITAETIRNALWLPSQALFESDGRRFVYVQSGASFTPADVKLVRRSESQAVIEGLAEGRVVTLANPDQMGKQPAKQAAGALQAISK